MIYTSRKKWKKLGDIRSCVHFAVFFVSGRWRFPALICSIFIWFHFCGNIYTLFSNVSYMFCFAISLEIFFYHSVYIIVFNFPRFYSIFCVDFSQLFDPFHTYLKHGTVMGSNICEWKQKYLWMDHFPSYLFVYRQANLCSGLRVIFVLNY